MLDTVYLYIHLYTLPPLEAGMVGLHATQFYGSWEESDP